MNKPLVSAFLIMAGLACPAFSQTLPVPVLQRAPARSEWTVFLHPDRTKMVEAVSKQGLGAPGAEIPAGSRELKSVTISKDGSIYREVSAWADGRKREKWISGELQVYDLGSLGKIARCVLPSRFQFSSNYSDFRRSDFEELEWIGKENFRGVKDIEGRKVFEFQMDAGKRRLTPREMAEPVDHDRNAGEAEQVKKSAEQATPSRIYTAYLDAQTNMPVYFDDGEIVRTYKFSEAPGSLSIPAHFALELDNWKKDLNRRRQLPKP